MIFRALIWAALAVALLVGSVQSGLQELQAVPIIHAAERFENQKVEAPEPSAVIEHAHAHGAVHDHGAAADAWTPADGLERQFWTWVANLLHAFSMALLVLAVMAVCQWRGSIMRSWKLAAWVAAAGWLSFHFWPSLGLPAEIPGMDAARLGSRQGWWVLAAVGAGLACATVALMSSPLRWAVAVVSLVLPFVVGAPHIVSDPLAGFTGEAQAVLRQLSGEFIWATTWMALSFWVSMGVVAGPAFQRWLRPAVAALLAGPDASRVPTMGAQH